MILKIEKNLKFLKKKSEPIEKFDFNLKKLVLDMEETINTANGIGLAAPQVGVLKRVMIIKIDSKNILMINPLLVSNKKTKDVAEEGCLSIPECFLKIKRWSNIDIKALDINGKEMKMNLRGLSARVFQHEIDHLDGILMIDRVSLVEKIKNIFKH